MKRILFLAFFLSVTYLFSQQVLQRHQIYFDHNIAYRSSDISVFSGIAEFRGTKGFLTRREFYENGIMIKKIIYHTTNLPKNTPEVPFQEINYKNQKIIDKISYSPTGEKYYYTVYDDRGDQKYSEQYRESKLSAIQHFKNGKLDGKISLMDIYGKWTDEYYKDGEFLYACARESGEAVDSDTLELPQNDVNISLHNFSPDTEVEPTHEKEETLPVEK